MANIISSPEDLVNLTLARIGWKRRIGSLYDGTEASKIALDLYSQTRDAQLVEVCPGFAERDLALTLLKTAPVGGYNPPFIWTSTYPILPWKYEYDYPGDMLQLRSLRITPNFIPVYDPQPVTWRIANDNSYTPTKKVILTNLASPIAVYTAQVTDPSVWDNAFIESLAAALGRRLAPALAGLEAAKFGASDEAAETQLSEMQQG